MTEPVNPPAPPLRTWRPMVLWSAGILLALGLAWLGARVLRLYRTHRTVVGSIRTGLRTPGSVIEALGDRERAVIRLAEYARLPRSLLKDDEARMVAFVYLGECGADGLRVILAALDDDDGEICTAARKSIPGLQLFDTSREEKARDLARLLSDRSVRIRFHAAETLASFGPLPESVLPDLLAAASDRSPLVRSYTAMAIGGVPNAAAAVPTLTAMLSDPDPEVRSTAAAALKKIRNE